MSTNERLAELSEAGVSVWLDDLSRDLLRSGRLAELIATRSVVGVTTNPSIFQAALSAGDSYAEQVAKLAADGSDVDTAIRIITTDDVRDACDVFAPVFVESDGVDGRVSIEVDPRLAHDTDATVALRRACRARKDLVRHRVAAANQLRAHLRNVLPGAVGLFSEIDSPINLAFLARFDTQDKTDWLTPKRLGDWLAKQGYSGKVDPAVLHQRLLDAPRGATGVHATQQAHITAGYVALLSTLVTQIKALETEIKQQLAAHADSRIFTSLPRSGRVRAARLLAEIGDCRARFPTPESLTCLAGAAPSTRQSGKSRVVGFRWSCDKQLRDAVCDFAADTRLVNPWAADLYDRARARGHDHPHAVRILARAWLHIIWHCWQDGVAYNPANHRALQRFLAT